MTLGKTSRGQRFIGKKGYRKSGVDVILCFLLCAAFYCIIEREREREGVIGVIEKQRALLFFEAG